MAFWILVAAIGGILSVAGLAVYIRRYLHGEITKLHPATLIVGYAAFVSFLLVDTLWPDAGSGPVTILILLPACAAILLLIREQAKSRGSARS